MVHIFDSKACSSSEFHWLRFHSAVTDRLLGRGGNSLLLTIAREV